ncbi:MAG: alpha-amylase [Flavobacteriales bacterium]|nr:alpha-amylase [Flavobacteriales bacterium]
MVKQLSIFCLVFVCVSCEESVEQKNPQYPENSAIYGIASPIQLSHEVTLVNLQDYFLEPTSIDSVQFPKTLSHNWSKEKTIVEINVGENVPQLSELKFWSGGFSYSILARKSKKEKIIFTYQQGQHDHSTVQLAGELNNWNPANTPLKITDGLWTTELWLNPGNYQYQIVLDDTWIMDPANRDSASNGIGGWNSLLKVGKKSNNKASIKWRMDTGYPIVTISDEEWDGEIFAFWENQLLNLESWEGKSHEYKVVIPEFSNSISNSTIRVFAYNSSGETNDLLLPLVDGKIVESTSELGRINKYSQVLYFMLVDRFHNGNSENDDPIQDPEVHEKANYFGGDLAGIKQKLETGYFEKLGINTLWLSPITQNPLHAEIEYPAPYKKYSGYHGYWPISCTKIDHRLGTSSELTALVDLAHSKGINLILDYVSNHVHEENPVFVEHPEWATQLNLPDGRKNIRIWDEQRLTTWFDTFLPTLDYSKPAVIDLMTDSALYLLQKYGLDGYRHDATKHIPEEFWRVLTQKIKNQIPASESIYQVGETFGSRELIGSYVGSGQMDGQFDFNLYFDARSVFAQDHVSFEKLHQSLMSSFSYYGYHSLMANITGNHDIPRFISYAGEGLRFDEDAKEAGWTREVKVENPVGYKKLSMLTAFVMTIPGVPVIYYGDEIGMAGAGDPDNRRPMKFDELNEYESTVKTTAEKLIKLRIERMSLIYGDYKLEYLSETAYAYSRSYFDEKTTIVFNKSNEVQTLEIGNKSINIQPYSFEIIID